LSKFAQLSSADAVYMTNRRTTYNRKVSAPPLGSLPMSTSVHMTRHGAQINFGDLPPYLSYARSPLPVAMPLGTSVFNCSQIKVILTCVHVKTLSTSCTGCQLFTCLEMLLKLTHHRRILQTQNFHFLSNYSKSSS
jgi:hypothetical protein